MLHVASVCTSCCIMLRVAGSCCAKLGAGQQLPTFRLFRDRQSVAQQCRIRPFAHVGATHAHFTWPTKSYGSYPSQDALQVSTLLGVVAHQCQHGRNNSQHCWPIKNVENVGSCWVCLYVALVNTKAAT